MWVPAFNFQIWQTQKYLHHFIIIKIHSWVWNLCPISRETSKSGCSIFDTFKHYHILLILCLDSILVSPSHRMPCPRPCPARRVISGTIESVPRRFHTSFQARPLPRIQVSGSVPQGLGRGHCVMAPQYFRSPIESRCMITWCLYMGNI